MSVIFKIPPQSQFVTTTNVFTADFNNNPAVHPGMYDFTFNTAGNANRTVLPLQRNSVYHIASISVGGNISEEQFLGSIWDAGSFPLLYVKRKIGNRNVYQRPIPVTNFFSGNEAACWVLSDKLGDELHFTFTGLLDQLPSMIGITTVKIQVQLNIFNIGVNQFTGAFRDVLSDVVGQTLRE